MVAIVVALNLVGSVGVCYILDTRDPVRDGVVLSGVAWASVILLRKLMLGGARRSARRHGFYNLGEATYELREESLRFTGTTFSCDIPYRAMSSVIQYSDKAAIVFSPIPGFLLPGRDNVAEGDLDTFVKELGKRLDAQPPDGIGRGDAE